MIEIERYREAIPLLGKALAEDPQDIYAACLLAQCHYELGEHKKALEYAEKAIQIEPDYEWGHRLRSFALGSLGRKKEALQSAREAVRLAPDEPFALQVLIHSLLLSGKAEQARPIAEQLLELVPDSETAHLAAGNVYLDMEYYHSAEKHYREALRINPASYNAQNNLGVIAVRRDGQAEFAMDHFSSAVKLNPANTLAIENIRSQISILPQLAVYISIIPLGIMGLFFSPVFGSIFILFGFIQLINTFVANYKNRRLLADEFKMLFKSEGYKDRANRSSKLFVEMVKTFLAKIWLAYLVGVSALILRLIGIYIDSTALWVISFIVFCFCPFIVYKKTNQA